MNADHEEDVDDHKKIQTSHIMSLIQTLLMTLNLLQLVCSVFFPVIRMKTLVYYN